MVSKVVAKCVLAAAAVTILIICSEEMKIALRNPLTARVPETILSFMDSVIDWCVQELRFLLASCGAKTFGWISRGSSEFCQNLLEYLPKAQSYLRESASNRLSTVASAHAYAAIKSSGEALRAGLTFAIAVGLAINDLLKFVVHAWNNELHAYDAQFAQVRFATAYSLLVASFSLCVFRLCQIVNDWIQGLVTTRGVNTAGMTDPQQGAAQGIMGVDGTTSAHNPREGVTAGAQRRSYIHNQA